MNEIRFRNKWPVLKTILLARFPQLARKDVEWLAGENPPPLDHIGSRINVGRAELERILDRLMTTLETFKTRPGQAIQDWQSRGDSQRKDKITVPEINSGQHSCDRHQHRARF